MDHEWCRVKQLVRHAQYGDPQETSLLIKEIRDYLALSDTVTSQERPLDFQAILAPRRLPTQAGS
jgi:hypothetical protein